MKCEMNLITINKIQDYLIKFDLLFFNKDKYNLILILDHG